MQNAIIDKISRSGERKHPKFGVGDKISVFVRLKEGDKERVQAFRGVVIYRHPKSGTGSNATFTVRKVSEGVGVERIFPYHSPVIDRIEVDSTAKIRRARLFYLRALKGRKARLKTGEAFADLVAPAVQPEAAPTTEAAPEAPKA